MTTTTIMMAVDIVAILILILAVYFPRHHRADLVVAFLGVNIGVLGVSTMLTTVDVSMGFGLGLFGVLSIIRLRSSEISQREIAYFFASLAIGLICGLSTTLNPLTLGVVALLLVTIAVSDSRRLFGAYFSEEIQLDRAISDRTELEFALSQLLNADILSTTVLELDLVNDTTRVSVRAKRRATATAEEESARNPFDSAAHRLELAR
ncbi:DUF4956 domain-containing protein [Corynebacterium sp. HMSC036D02]|uniref:DUF4956 domain-containing protein n=1 Tax=Corynebacterium sp. HMSC036D02 TaxID=1715013 RepID=UPI0008A96FF6|nr:DUF4956 domain-containing protein [Corynebacterium sp. HMSC036D02]